MASVLSKPLETHYPKHGGCTLFLSCWKSKLTNCCKFHLGTLHCLIVFLLENSISYHGHQGCELYSSGRPFLEFQGHYLQLEQGKWLCLVPTGSILDQFQIISEKLSLPDFFLQLTHLYFIFFSNSGYFLVLTPTCLNLPGNLSYLLIHWDTGSKLIDLSNFNLYPNSTMRLFLFSLCHRTYHYLKVPCSFACLIFFSYLFPWLE